MLMTTEEALFAGVLALPHDNLPRLVYADFLEESGHAERAEFIRLQCELNNLDQPLGELLPLKTRERLLLDRYSLEWLAPLRAKGEALQNPGTHGLFRRGFVEIVWMPAGIFNWKAAKLFRKAPVLELRITRLTRDELPELLHTPELQCLDTLDLSSHRLDWHAVTQICSTTAILSLKKLRLRNCSLDDECGEVLIDCPDSWKELQELDLTHNSFTANTVQQLRIAYGTRVKLSEPRQD